MSREWKPGDVALVNDCTQPDKAWRAATCKEAARPGQQEAVWILHDNGGKVWSSVSDARPLVVIDPEDREAIRRLRDLLADQCIAYGHATPTHDLDPFVDALREFADPKPPRPDEPMGLGAVVEDTKGKRWIRVGAHDVGIPRPWAEHGNVGDLSAWVRYADITAAKVLSEGVR